MPCFADSYGSHAIITKADLACCAVGTAAEWATRAGSLSRHVALQRADQSRAVGEQRSARADIVTPEATNQ